MKKLALLSLAVVLVLAMAGSAAALLSPETVAVGGDRQRASNPLADDEDYHNVYITTTVTLTNEHATETLTNLQLGAVTLLSGFTASDLDVTVVTPLSATSLAPSASATLTLRLRVPANLDAINSDYEKDGFHVANLPVQFTNSTGTFTEDVQLNLERENQLFFDSLTICANSDCLSVKDGTTISDLKPGDKIEIKASAENKYKDNDREDVQIEDVFLEWMIDDAEFDEEDEADFGDLSPKDVEEESFAFVIDDEVADGTYDLVLKLSGRDENSALHGEKAVIELKVKRDRHDLALREITVSPKSLDCDSLDRHATFHVEVANIGKSDEDETVLRVENAELKLEALQDLAIDESETMATNLRVEIPADAKPGAYSFRVSAFYDTSVLADEQLANLVVPVCVKAVAEEEKEEAIIVPPAPEVPQEPVVDKKVFQKSNLLEQFTESNAYIALLVVGIVLAMLILVFLVVRVVPPRKE